MPDTGRLFLCARCSAQVVICRACDRGHIYCSPACSGQARRASLRAAGRRYQASRAGRFAHAERARRYRARCKIVTHQGSAEPPGGDLLAVTAASGAVSARTDSAVSEGAGPRCHVCNARCAQALRLGFVRQRRLRVAWEMSRDEHSP
jgi:hypothetical protein